MQVRKSEERGKFSLDWLDAKYTFSFSNYYDSRFMGFRQLRVINQDVIHPAGGFPTHPHRDMEIVTFIMRGELKHRDTLGNEAVISPGMIQTMSAGHGIMHSEFNPSDVNETESLQIWIEAKEKNLEPSYSEFVYKDRSRPNEPTLILSGDKSDGVATINQDIKIFHLDMKDFSKSLGESTYWLQVLSGELQVNQKSLTAGDGASLTNEELNIQNGNGELLIFEFE